MRRNGTDHVTMSQTTVRAKPVRLLTIQERRGESR